MNEYIKSVREFHENFNHPINNQKDEILLETRQLRIKLIFEELKELAEASDVKKTFYDLCKEEVKSDKSWMKLDDDKINILDDEISVNKKEELDALCDLQYVLSGAILSLGYQDVFEQAFEEVHNSNMSKMCHNKESLDDTINDYTRKGIETYSLKKDYAWIVYRTSDNKILKSINYKEVQLEKFIK